VVTGRTLSGSCDQGQKLMAEFLKMIAATMTAKEATARLEGELAALKARPWWRRLSGRRAMDPER
jgi:hypothetical protein